MKKKAAVYRYDEIDIGSVHSFTRTITHDDVLKFAELSGDLNPLHLSEVFGRSSQFGKNVVHGMLTASLFSTLLGMYCPGVGAPLTPSAASSRSLRWLWPTSWRPQRNS